MATRLVVFIKFPHEASYWKNVTSALSEKITSVKDLRKTFFMIMKREYDVSLLEFAIHKVYSDEQRKDFFEKVVPFLQNLVLNTPKLFSQYSEYGLPALMRYKNKTLKFTREQAACILANSFFSTWDRDSDRRKWEKEQLPSINFDDLYGQDHNNDAKVAKILMILHYFNRISAKMPQGYVEFTRQFIHHDDLPEFASSAKPLRQLQVLTKGAIEDAKDALQVDFANEYIGGTALSHGAVQEEIRFMINPELIISRLFTEVMDDTEAVIMTGAEQFCSYMGYSKTLQFGGDYVDDNVDEQGNIKTTITAIDALVFREKPETQWIKKYIDRELNKAYVGFYSKEPTTQKVATGNWGCGVFAGDKELKAVIQWLAASEAERDTLYYTFGDDKLSESLSKFVTAVLAKNITIGEIYHALLSIKPRHDKSRSRNLPKTLEMLSTALQLK
jgi:poly(ADP-ribose) glycohydrolase